MKHGWFLGGGGLFAAFPLAYAVIMPALYIPVIMMLLGLIFRGVALRVPVQGAKKQGVCGTMHFTLDLLRQRSCRGWF